MGRDKLNKRIKSWKKTDVFAANKRQFMKTKNIFILVIKVIVLSFILAIYFIVASILSGLSAQPDNPGQQAGIGSGSPPVDFGSALVILLLVSLVQASILSYLILRSRWSGWKLVGAIFLAFYGSMTVVAQIESIVFLPRQLPAGMISKLFVMGAIVAGLFSPTAVLTLGNMRHRLTSEDTNPQLIMLPGDWAWKLTAIAIIYVILYFTFGYFLAWKNPAVQAYYGGTDPGSFFAQVVQIWRTTPWMFPLQAFRALLWLAFVLPVIRMLRGHSWEIGFAIALLFAVWSSQLLLPNPYMPAAVARAHLVETVSSNLIFGWCVGWLLYRHHVSLHDLFRVKEQLKR
jgi:hypothetical protein